MTKKDYQMIADVIHTETDESERRERGVISEITEKLADTFEADNDRFDRDSFLIACGVPR